MLMIPVRESCISSFFRSCFYSSHPSSQAQRENTEDDELRQKYCYPGGGRKSGKRIRCAKSRVTLAGMDKTMSKPTRIELLRKLRRRYESAGVEHKRKLLDQAQELLGYHRKSGGRIGVAI